MQKQGVAYFEDSPFCNTRYGRKLTLENIIESSVRF
jgi:hypothetical protein